MAWSSWQHDVIYSSASGRSCLNVVLAQVQALQGGLELRAACRTSATGRQPWGPETTAALKHVSAAIRETDACTAAGVADA